MVFGGFFVLDLLLFFQRGGHDGLLHGLPFDQDFADRLAGMSGFDIRRVGVFLAMQGCFKFALGDGAAIDEQFAQKFFVFGQFLDQLDEIADFAIRREDADGAAVPDKFEDVFYVGFFGLAF